MKKGKGKNKKLRKPPVAIAAGAAGISMNSRNKKQAVCGFLTKFTFYLFFCLIHINSGKFDISYYMHFFRLSQGKRKSPHIECTSTCAGLLVTPEHLMKYNRHGRHGKCVCCERSSRMGWGGSLSRCWVRLATTRATSGTWLWDITKTSPGHWLARTVRDG